MSLKKVVKQYLNTLYVSYNTKKIRHTYKSKHNLSREKQIVLLTIIDFKNGIILL